MIAHVATEQTLENELAKMEIGQRPVEKLEGMERCFGVN